MVSKPLKEKNVSQTPPPKNRKVDPIYDQAENVAAKKLSVQSSDETTTPEKGDLSQTAVTPVKNVELPQVSIEPMTKVTIESQRTVVDFIGLINVCNL